MAAMDHQLLFDVANKFTDWLYAEGTQAVKLGDQERAIVLLGVSKRWHDLLEDAVTKREV